MNELMEQASAVVQHGRGLTAAQREMRRTGIGGSEIAAVLGVGTRKTDDGERRTAFDVWFGKVHPMERVDSVDAMRGIYLEPGIGDWYLSRTGRTRGLAPGTVRHIDFPVGVGSAITYARRYGLSAMVGVAPDDDDDGNEASRPASPVRALASVPPPSSGPTSWEVRINEATSVAALAAIGAELHRQPEAVRNAHRALWNARNTELAAREKASGK